jgi:hypothetical protein
LKAKKKSIREVLSVGADQGRREQFKADCNSQTARLHLVKNADDAVALLIKNPSIY